MAVSTDHASADSQPWRDVYTVSRLNREGKALLEGAFPPIWIEGEVSNLARPRSGHLYFSLKDEQAHVRCAMFRNRNAYLGFQPREGMGVLARARVSLYEPRGDFQLIVEHMEEAGDGALRRAFEALKKRLSEEGLFESAHKRALPTLPRRIGVVTSPSGAAVRDIIHVLRRRFPAVGVVVYPVPVQGEGAAEEIAAMIHRADERDECDVLIVARGGGSLEDLWAFNEEPVARAVFHCRRPVVAGVGHETDVTICDFVADQRAPTPSAAAELVVPDAAAWVREFGQLETRLVTAQKRHLDQSRRALDGLGKRLAPQHPGRRLQERMQRLDELESRLGRAQRGLLRHGRARLGEALGQLQRYTPIHRVERLTAVNAELFRRLTAALRHGLDDRQRRLAATARALEAVSPLATLSRGYAIITTEAGRVLTRAADTGPGATVHARLAEGRIICEVKETHDET